MLFDNLAFFARFGFFRRGLAFFSKGVWQPCGCQPSYSKRQKLLYIFWSKWRFATIKMTSASNYNCLWI